MFDHDEAAFYTLLLDTDEAIRPGTTKRTAGAMNLVFDDLRQYPLELIAKALTAHRRDPDRGQWLPNSSHIEHQINIRRPVVWLTADEAWSRITKAGKAVKMSDGKMDYRAAEPAPCLLNNEMAQALASAETLLAEGDKTAARMAFKGAYDRLVDRAKLERRGPVYFVSPGGSFDDQQAVVAEGVRMGLLAAPKHSTDTSKLVNSSGTRTSGVKPDVKALLLTMQPRVMAPPEREDYE